MQGNVPQPSRNLKDLPPLIGSKAVSDSEGAPKSTAAVFVTPPRTRWMNHS